MEDGENGEVSIDKAIEILKRNGLEVTPEEAKKILDFLFKLAEISLANSMVKPP